MRKFWETIDRTKTIMQFLIPQTDILQENQSDTSGRHFGVNNIRVCVKQWYDVEKLCNTFFCSANKRQPLRKKRNMV